MRPRTATKFVATATLVTLLLTSVYAELASADDGSSGKDLATTARKAKGDFRALEKSDVERAKAALLDSVRRQDRRLAQDGANGQAWRTFLKTADLLTQLDRSEGPNLASLGQVLARYDAGHEGLGLVYFLDVRQALHNYLATSYAVDNKKIRGEFEDRVEKLAADLEAYAAKPTTETALRISETVRWLDGAHQVPELLAAIDSQLSHQNFAVQLSPALLAAAVAGPVDDCRPVRDCILGTDIHATAHTRGNTIVELPSNPDFGVMDTLFFGTTFSTSVGYNGPVTIYSTSTTELAARKRLWIDIAGGLLSHETASRADTDVSINNIQSNKGRRIVENMAWKRAGKQQSEAECIASRHAEDRLNAQIDRQAADSIQRANRDYVNKLYAPLNDRKLFPGEVHASTTPKAISLTGLQGGGGKLAAPTALPAVGDGADLSLRLHESAINNFTFDALAGRTVYEERMQAAAVSALGHLPDKMKGDEDGKPWAITFAPRQPISVSFGDNRIKVTLRGVRYIKGTETYPAMNVSAEYKIEASPSGFKAVRQGELEVFPPDFVPGTPIDARRQTIRTLLAKRFNKVFEKEFLGKGIELPNTWKTQGRLIPIQFVARDGWLTVAWKIQPAAPAPVLDKVQQQKD